MTIDNLTAVLFPDGEAWSEALCLHRPHLWFSEHDDDLAAEAKAICTVCPVQLACLCRAVRCHAEDGIWGAADMSNPHERTAARRALRELVEPVPRPRIRARRSHPGLVPRLRDERDTA